MRLAIHSSVISAALLSGAAAVHAASAFDTGAEPVYQLLPEIPMTGAALPPEAPGFVLADRTDKADRLRWGKLFRVAGDPRVYGRLTGRDEALPQDGAMDVTWLRSPAGLFAAQAALPARGSPGGRVRVLPLSGDAPVMQVAADGIGALLSPDACGAVAGADAGWTVGPGAATLLGAAWSNETDIRMIWQVPVRAGGAAPVAQPFDVTLQMAALAAPRVVTCAAAAPGAEVGGPAYPVRRDLVSRLRVLTFYRLTVMQETAPGTRPVALAAGPGLVFSTLDSSDPAVQAALSAMQPAITVVAAEPQVPPAVAQRKRATGFLRPVDNGLPQPRFTRTGFGAIRGEKAYRPAGGAIMSGEGAGSHN